MEPNPPQGHMVEEHQEQIKTRVFQSGYTEQLFHCWNSPSVEQVTREVTQSPSLEVFKSLLDKAPSKLV